MSWQSAHEEPHLVGRTGWLRAAVLGANDGIVSISALIVGVAAAGADSYALLVAGFAGLSAGAMSMAAGEYVSVSSQADLETAEVARERLELAQHPEAELAELISIYESRGVSPETARQVAIEMTEADALSAHMRDEIGLSETMEAHPLQAALASGLTFSVAGAVPLLAAVLAPASAVILSVALVTLAALALLGALGAWAGRAPMGRAVARVVFWGVGSMAVTLAIGRLFGVTMG